MTNLETLTSKGFTPNEIKDLESIRVYGDEFYNFIVFNSEAQDKYSATHKGFQEALKNKHIWSNYIHAAILGQSKLLIPTDITLIDKSSDYFIDKDANVFEKYVSTLYKLFNTTTYRKLLMMGISPQTKQ